MYVDFWKINLISLSLILSFPNKGAEPNDSCKSSLIPPSFLSPYLIHCEAQLILPPTYWSNLPTSLYLSPVHLKLVPFWLKASGFQPGLAISTLACLQIYFLHHFQSDLFEMKSKHIMTLVRTLLVIALWMKTKLFTMAFKGLQNLGPAYFSYCDLLDVFSVNILDLFQSLIFPTLPTNTESSNKLFFFLPKMVSTIFSYHYTISWT